MKEFFKVTDLEGVLRHRFDFHRVEIQDAFLADAHGRILAEDVVSDSHLPDFPRSTMDGFAVKASSTFGASEGNPAYLDIKGSVTMGEKADVSLGPGEACRISTGGMLPKGADGVVMVEHTEAIDSETIEVYKSVAPGQNMLEIGEDFKKGETILEAGRCLRPQEIGLLAAFGKEKIRIYEQPVVGIISTGDEIVPIHEKPGPGRIRDVNSYTLSGFIRESGGIPVIHGIVKDHYQTLYDLCHQALDQCHMLIISGGSSVGSRDFTIDVLSNLPESEILVHGISISPGKPTILARSRNKAVWGLPGHTVSAMVVYKMVVEPFLKHVSGFQSKGRRRMIHAAFLSRNVSSAQGRTDFIRIRLYTKDGKLWAEPILGKSGLIHTMVKADGLLRVDANTEGLDKGSEVSILPFQT